MGILRYRLPSHKTNRFTKVLHTSLSSSITALLSYNRNNYLSILMAAEEQPITNIPY